MTDDEFNSMKVKEHEAALKAKGYDGMHSSRESQARDKKLEEYWDNQPDPDEYNGAF